MILDIVPYTDSLCPTQQNHSVKTFIRFLEKKFGALFVTNLHNLAYENAAIADIARLAQTLLQRGVIQAFFPVEQLVDEPKIKLWNCQMIPQNTGGVSVTSDEQALTAALAEALERHIWYSQTDYFTKPQKTSTAGIARVGNYIPPEAFVGYSDKQRQENPRFTLGRDAQYLWIEGRSLTSKKNIYLPAQVVSAALPLENSLKEPLIKQQTTIGLATWYTLEGARLAGALEVVEREAFMIMWYNQLTLPRVNLESLRNYDKNLDTLLERCARYNLKVHAIPMMTDAPTHAVCVVVEDMSGKTQQFAFGLKAHRSMTRSIEGATLEALRARRTTRNFFAHGGTWDPLTPIENIGHFDRQYFWRIPENAKKLEFLVEGELLSYSFTSPWEHDTEAEHLARVINWCKSNDFECVSVSLGKSKINVSNWHIEVVVMPDLHPTHLYEKMQHLNPTRLTAVPLLFGYTPLATPHTKTPHPYT